MTTSDLIKAKAVQCQLISRVRVCDICFQSDKCADWIIEDERMLSPSPEQPAYGASRTVGGFSRGRQPVANMADFDLAKDTTIAVNAIVYYASTSSKPSSIIPEVADFNRISKLAVYQSWGTLLPALAKKWPGFKSTLIYHLYNILCLMLYVASTSSKGLDVTLFVWDTTPPPAWEPLGKYDDIVEEDAPVPWEIRNEQAELYILLVCTISFI